MRVIMKEYQLLISSVLLLSAAVIFAGALFLLRPGSALPSSPAVSESGVSVQNTKKLSPPSDVPHRSESLNAYAFIGVITSVGADSIVINTGSLAAPDPAQLHTIKIVSSTDIYAPGPPKDSVTLAKEIALFRQKTSGSDNEGIIYVGPTAYTHRTLTLAELKPGMAVAINPASVEGSTVSALEVVVTGGAPVK